MVERVFGRRRTHGSRGIRRVVSRNEAEGWDVRDPTSDRVSSHHLTFADAVAWAIDIVKNAGGGEVVLKGARGAEPEELEIHASDERLTFVDKS
jgi:Uncharacterized protein conserved in bacteria (DUF2188)